MKRFYCTECKKVKRVQNLPARIENSDHKNPTNRIGVCNHHISNRKSISFSQLVEKFKGGR